MPNDERPSRRRSQGTGGRTIRPISLGGSSTLSMTEGVSNNPAGPLGASGSATQISAASEGFPIEMALAEGGGPWKKDRVILSIEAQALLLEMRVQAKNVIEFAGQIYSNVVSQLKVAAGRLLTLEAYGGYRIRWKT